MLTPRTLAVQCGIDNTSIDAVCWFFPAIKPILDRPLTIKIDAPGQRVLVRLGQRDILDKSFEEVNAYAGT